MADERDSLISSTQDFDTNPPESSQSGHPHSESTNAVSAIISPTSTNDSVQSALSNETADEGQQEPPVTDSEALEQADHQSNGDGLKKPTAKSRGGRWFSVAWWLEALACAMSIAALLTLFGTLFAYQNRPSPHWPRWISLNTIVALCVVVLKTGALLVLTEGIGQIKWSWFAEADRPLEHIQMWDDATRGPVGAAVLLWRLHGRNLSASLGALVIVLALAVDPFAQQIIHYQDCTVTSAGAARLPRANSFSGGGDHMGALSESIVPGVQSAINAGVFSPNNYTNFDCSTGNCTWINQYSTLAWCSTCQNITDQLVIQTRNHTTKTAASETGASNETQSTYAGYSILTGVRDGISVDIPSTGLISAEWPYAAMGPSPSGVSLEGPAGIFASGSIDYITGAKPPPCNESGLDPVWPCKGPLGVRCTFFPCVKTLNASVQSGQLMESLVDTGHEWGAINDGGAMVDVNCLNSAEVQSLKNLGYGISDGQRYLAYNVSATFNWNKIDDSFPSSLVLHNCLYTTDVTWQYSIRDYFTTLLNGTIMGYMPTPVTPPGYFWGPQIVQTIFNYGNATVDSITDAFNNISVSLTNYMRENGSPNYYKGTRDNPIYSTPAMGTVQQTKICVRIRWGWIAYPTVLVVLTLVFFVLLLVETWPTTSRPQIWKSSPLALLYHGLANEVQESDYDKLDEVKGMKEMAKSTSVKLEESLSGLVQIVEKRKVEIKLT